MAFYSGEFYRDIGLNWSGTGFAYIFLLLLVCVVPQAVKWQVSLLNFAEHAAPALIKQVPVIKIINGEASALAAQPYTIVDPRSGAPLAIVDTTGATVSLDGSDAMLLVKKTEVIVKQPPMAPRAVSFADVGNLTVSQDGINSGLKMISRYGGLAFALVALLWAFLFRMAQALVYGALGLGIASLLGTNVRYGTLVRLAAMAVTPVIIVSAAADLAGFEVPYAWPLAFAAAMGYLFLGVKSVSGQAAAAPAPAEAVTD